MQTPIIRSGRALQLEGLDSSVNKVTLGFKCSPKLKIRLAQEAAQYGMTLSEYVESLVENSRQAQESNDVHKDNTNSHAYVKELQRKVDFYENSKLRSAFVRHRGTTYHFEDTEGIEHEVFVSSVEDVFTILMLTVKLQ